MPKYRVRLGRRESLRAEVIVEAEHTGEADDIAHEMDRHGELSWDCTLGSGTETLSIHELPSGDKSDAS